MTPKRIEPFLEATPGCLDFFLNLTPESPATYRREEEYFSLESFASSLRLSVGLLFWTGCIPKGVSICLFRQEPNIGIHKILFLVKRRSLGQDSLNDALFRLPCRLWFPLSWNLSILRASLLQELLGLLDLKSLRWGEDEILLLEKIPILLPSCY